jgi:hypothetical protein
MADIKDDSLNEILGQIKKGRVVLFLGAGASHVAGGPSGKKLTEMLKANFPKIDQSLNSFIEVCQDIIDTPPYNRNELESFIKDNLGKLQPTDYHKIMTRYDWPAVFTTNFDDLVEVAYRISTQDRLKDCQPIYSDRFLVNTSDRGKVYLFKIMGCMRAIEGESGNMVLSRSDYNSALIRRRKYLEILSDFVKTGTIVFLGYSFEDHIVLDIIDDLIAIYGKDRLPWSYALFDKLQSDPKIDYKFSSRKIIPLENSFEDFFKFLNINYKTQLQKDYSKYAHFKLRGHELEITDTEERQYAEYFDFLTEEKITQEPGEKDKFFLGNNKSWGAFKENWDFKRNLYISPKFKRNLGKKEYVGCLKEKVLEELRKYEPKDNKVILLTGMAGVGKSILLRRLAYDIYKSGESLAIFVNIGRINFDYKMLSSFIEDINHKLNQKVGIEQKAPPIKPIIIIDNAASVIRHVNRLKDYLASRGRPALIIAAERTGEWNLIWKTFQFNILEENIYELNENLDAEEKTSVVDHFHNLGYIATKGAFWDDIIAKYYNDSYFATIYSLVHPSKKPLNEIIKDQYDNLTSLTQKAFQYICAFHQFDLPINLDLLVRSLKCTYQDFTSEVIGKDAAKIIFEEQDLTGNLLYRSHHRIIAKKTVEFFFGDPEMQKNIFLEILGRTNLSNLKEREICQKLMVAHIGPNAEPRLFTYEQQRQIFKMICENNPVRSLMHHWGILETDDHQYAIAEKLLKRALEIPRDEVESFRGESDQNILTSLGNLYSHMGMDFLKKGDRQRAEEYFQNAEESFQGAKYGEFPNAHAYHSHATMWYVRGNQAKDPAEKVNYYANALEIIEIAKDNLNEEELQQICELEILIQSQIGDETKISQLIETLKTKYKSPRGFYLNALLLFRNAREKTGEEKRKLLELALIKVEEGLSFFSSDEHCLRLQCKLIKELEPNNLQKYHASLQKWKAVVTVPNVWLLYELGRVSFILEYYDHSRNYFQDLEAGIGMGHKHRSRPRNPIVDEKGNIKEYEGTIINTFSSYEGNLKCDTLRSLKYPIGFRPIACKFMAASGDRVKFQIEFSFRGPRAENVRKL